jgi:hypothetical protein
MAGLLIAEGTVWLVSETGKRFGLAGAVTWWQDGLRWSLLSRSATAGPSNIQHDKQPQEPKQHQLIENRCGIMVKPPRSVVKRRILLDSRADGIIRRLEVHDRKLTADS